MRITKDKKMRLIIFIILLTFSAQSFGQKIQKLKGQPTTLEETYAYLDQMFDDTTKYSFMTLPEDFSAGRLHHGLGTWIRNNWGLWGNSKLKQYFLAQGFTHPDEMSSKILTSYHRYLNGKQITDRLFFPSISSYYYPKPKKITEYFPVNDTIFVSVYADYRKFLVSKASGVRATAVVRKHIGNQLLVEIISIRREAKKKPDRKVGDIFEADPIYCDLIPPKGWKFERK